ncbi:importin subunit beta-1 [Nematocida sp. LUAm3]|nr:importin subunit beta-1 [Nematocida sp. LUAm3]KAI5176138.1 importin subunit beta-1 [Nematocida sp. LUAm2]KAI5179026.1 importin subunit beta-1 [Nematocida sp. LUAm1]
MSTTRIIKALSQLQSFSNEERREAEEIIVRESQENFQLFLDTLLEVLISEKAEVKLSMVSGMVLKSFFFWESLVKRKQVEERWVSLREEEREKVKEKLLKGIETCGGKRGEVLSQCLGAVARIEIVGGRWPNAFQELVRLSGEGSSVIAKKNTIETLGYLSIDSTGMENEVIIRSSGSILTAIVNGINSGNEEVVLSAFKTLEKSLSFIEYHISIENECKAIMSTMYSGCSSSNTEIASMAMQCFIGALYLYYKKLIPYVHSAFGEVAMAFLFSDEEEKILSAIELWGTVAEVEIEGVPQTIPEISEKLAGRLFDLLPNEYMEQTNEWVPHKAAAWLLSLIAECDPLLVSKMIILPKTGNRVKVEEAVQKMLSDQSNRVVYEAGLIALGSMINEENAQKLYNLITRIMGSLPDALDAKEPIVLDSAVWLFEKLFKYAFTALSADQNISHIILRITEIIKSDQDASVNSTWALAQIIESIRSHQRFDKAAEEEEWMKMVQTLLEQLLTKFFQLNETAYNMRTALVSVICQLIESTHQPQEYIITGIAVDTAGYTKNELLNPRANEELLSAHMGILQTCIRKVKASAQRVSPEVIEICVYIIEREGWLGLYTDAYLLLGALADTLAVDFVNFAEYIMPYALRDLQRICMDAGREEGFNIFTTALITFIGSSASAMHLGFSLYVDHIMPLLIQAVNTIHLPREAKVASVSTFADISLAVGKSFNKYIESMLQIAISIISLKKIEEDISFIVMLQDSLLDLLSCIIQASDGKNSLVIDNISIILEIIKQIVVETTDALCIVKILYLISDMVLLYGSAHPLVLQHLETEWIIELINAKASSGNKEIREAAITTRSHLSSTLQTYTH